MISLLIFDRTRAEKEASSALQDSLRNMFRSVSSTSSPLFFSFSCLFFFLPSHKESRSLSLSTLTWLPLIPEELSGIWPVDQSGLKIDGPRGQWNTFLLHEQQIIFKWKLDNLSPNVFSRNTEIPVTRGILCFPSRLALRWSVFKLRTHFKFFPFYLKNMMMFWCHAELTRTFNCVNLCVFMFTQVCFIPLCQIFMHMKPSFVSAGCVWISRGQNVSSLLSYRHAASKSVCVCLCAFTLDPPVWAIYWYGARMSTAACSWPAIW